MRKFLALVALLISPAYAEDLGVEVQAFPDRMREQFRKVGDHTSITKVSCLEASKSDPKSRLVCTYKLGDYMVAMSAAAPGETMLSDLTLICAAKRDTDGLRCITAYGAAIAAAVPDVEVQDRGKIIKALFAGVEVGDAAQIKKDGRRFILQHAMGLWFHIEADDE